MIDSYKVLLFTYMKKKAEKRASSRAAICQSLSFEMSEKVSGRFKNVPICGFGVDICLGGIGLITDRILNEGDVLKLFIPVAEVNILLPVYTEVMWSRPTDGDFRAGLRFLA